MFGKKITKERCNSTFDDGYPLGLTNEEIFCVVFVLSTAIIMLFSKE